MQLASGYLHGFVDDFLAIYKPELMQRLHAEQHLQQLHARVVGALEICISYSYVLM